MSKLILLDSGPLGIISNPSKSDIVLACREWAIKQHEQGNVLMRRSIATALGMLRECSGIPELVRLLADQQGNVSVRESIAAFIEQLANDEPIVYSLATILLQGGDGTLLIVFIVHCGR